jgi:hypothetical protein
MFTIAILLAAMQAGPSMNLPPAIPESRADIQAREQKSLADDQAVYRHTESSDQIWRISCVAFAGRDWLICTN